MRVAKQRKSVEKGSIVLEEFRLEVLRALKEQDVSLSELARRTGLTRFYLQRVFSRREICPTLDAAARIAEVLGLEMTTKQGRKK